MSFGLGEKSLFDGEDEEGEEIDCIECDGEGVDENGDICEWCGGTGVE